MHDENLKEAIGICIIAICVIGFLTVGNAAVLFHSWISVILSPLSVVLVVGMYVEGNLDDILTDTAKLMSGVEKVDTKLEKNAINILIGTLIYMTASFLFWMIALILCIAGIGLL